MPRRIQKPGLKGALFGSLTLALACVLGALFFLVPLQVEHFLQDRLVSQGREKVQQAARTLARERPTTVAEMQDVLDMLKSSAADLRFIAVLGADHRVVARSNEGPQDLAPFINAFKQGGSPGLEEPVDGSRLFTEPLVVEEGSPAGTVLTAVDFSSLGDVVAVLRRTVLIAFVAGFALITVLLLLVSREFILRPLASMMSVARKLSEDDLTGKVEVETEDELGRLAGALNRIGESLRDTLGRVRGVSEGVAEVIEQLSRTGTTVSSGAATIQARVEETSTSMVQMMSSLRGIAESVEVLYQSAEESSSSIMEMATTNDEVAENVQDMAGSVQETAGAIEQMTGSIKEVAKNIEMLHATTAETSSSLGQMDSSIEQVETNATETARLSEEVSEDAQTGVESLRKTLSGIDRIKESSRTASSVMESLGRRISEIGNILGVIDDVAEQTNLLALNAAIIAAQAGEHGKGFAVVADEIKDLAERTGVSTKEISSLIRGVQDESRNAVAVMNQGVRNVEEGVELGREAEAALRKINESARKSTERVKAIAHATVEQARGSRQVTAAIHRIAQTVQQISTGSNAQARGSEQIMKSADRMKALTLHVLRSSQEQAHGSKQIARSIENINEMVTHLNRAQKAQARGGEQVLKAVDAIKDVSEHQTRSVRQLEEAIESLQRQAEVLRAVVRRFRV